MPDSPSTIGVLHPGQMGASVAASAMTSGARVLWASEGRSEATATRAADSRLEDAGDLAALLNSSEVVISVCPPHAALEVARDCAATGFRGVFVDANAVAPATARSIADVVEAAGAAFVDGGIIGPPARRPGSTRMYLSGQRSDEVARAFTGGPLEVMVIDGGPGAASALKMTYAAYTKGTSALLAAIMAVAEREGVRDALISEWGRGDSGLAARREAQVRASAGRAWRFVGEMQEIAATFAAAGLPSGFHEAAAETFARLSAYKDAPEPPPIEALIDALLADQRSR